MKSFACSILLAVVVAAQGPPPLPPLPPVPFPPQNPFTPAKAVLGKILFWEEQLSSDDTVACGTCHAPAQAWGDPRDARAPGRDGQFLTPDDAFGSPGLVRTDAQGRFQPDPAFALGPQVTGRTAPNIGTAMYSPLLFWDGRATPQFVDPQTQQVLIPLGGALESQAVAPVLSSVEMAHAGRSWTDVTGKLGRVRPMALASNLPADVAAALQQNASYPNLFRAAFGDPAITAARVAFAIATYERTLAPNQTPHDQNALTPAQQRGRGVFVNQGRCAICHGGPFLSDNQFHNTGVRPAIEDLGRQAITGNPGQAGAFKTPGLRNAGLKRRFQHNGQQSSLEQVVDFYARGGDFRQNQDPRIQPFLLQPPQRADLLDFLRNGLTDPRLRNSLPPFDRPRLRSEIAPPGSNVYGLGSAGSGGIVPAILAHVPASTGSQDFKIGVARGLGGMPALLGFAAGPAALDLGGLRVNLDPATLFVVPYEAALGGAGPGSGFGTFALPIPADPTLRGGTFVAQWFVADPSAAAGLSSSPGARFGIL